MQLADIYPTVTASGKQVTFQASRTQQTGHADLAWAVMHALDKTELQSVDGTTPKKKGRMRIFS